jgi:2-dehydropantoate 2-reductase
MPRTRYARWEKLCWNIPFNGLSVAAGGIGTQTITADAELRRTAERAMREVICLGNADLAAAGSSARLDADEVVTRMFTLTDTMGDYRTSMVIDFVLGRPLEVEAILGNPGGRGAARRRTDDSNALRWSRRPPRAGLIRTLQPADVASLSVV